jgi:hypothetical protein
MCSLWPLSIGRSGCSHRGHDACGTVSAIPVACEPDPAPRAQAGKSHVDSTNLRTGEGDRMKLPMLSAVALAFTLSGAVFAAEDPQSPARPAPTRQDDQPGTSQSDRDALSQKNRDYQSALKQCDSSTDRERCVDAVKRKFGQI